MKPLKNIKHLVSLKRLFVLVMVLLSFLVSVKQTMGTQRFPKPEFESGYIQPGTLMPASRAGILDLLDVVVLLGALSVISWLVIKKRSRKGVFWTSLFSLAYFGFFRKGCVCAIGSIQNVTLAFFDSTYAIPFTVIAFFILPLVFTLFFGRTFCAGVCPFGAVQDLVAFKPQKLDPRINTVLGLFPYLYLGFAVLFAATGTDFIICRYDPFVGIFRLNASFQMFLFTGILLISGIFIARPYCRFLCPYGVILNWFSKFSRKHLTITPKECVQCRLCESSCPYGAIDIPLTERNPENKQSRTRKFIFILVLLPVLALLGGYLGSRLYTGFANVNSKVRLSKEILSGNTFDGDKEKVEVTAFKSSGKTVAEMYKESEAILGRFKTGSWLLGGFIGLVFGFLVAGKMISKYHTDYTPNKGRCYSCARCTDYCPVK